MKVHRHCKPHFIYAASLITLILLLFLNTYPISASASMREAPDKQVRRERPTINVPVPSPTGKRRVIAWRGSRSDPHWSNPANWEGGLVPGESDVARFTAYSTSDALVDAGAEGALAGLVHTHQAKDVSQ